jgi:2-polyprenyl-6-methoxyphenol hydroxylase-like FAD-dependent oxidoreductase
MSHYSASHDRIAIVGAGPVGLLAAIELFWRGVKCRVFEQASAPTETSKACVVHARALEMFDQLGIADRFISQGRRARRMNYHFLRTGEVAVLDFEQLSSSYPYMLNISQADTERILREYLAELGGIIEWNTEVQSVITESADRITVRVADKANGREETLHPQWVVGCDGVHSTVRRQMGISFVGGEYYAHQMRMTDTPVIGLPLSEEDTDYLVEDDRMTLFINLPGDNHRMLVSDMSEDPETEITQAAFQSVLDRLFHGTVTLGQPDWASNFTIRSRISEYRCGNVFLAGDAAHTHSPAGAQGMNLGFGDAHNLGWKLAHVAKGEAPAALLDSYVPQRRRAAEDVIKRTQTLHNLLMAHGTPIADRLAIIRDPGFIQRAVTGISGISTNHRHAVPVVPGMTPLDGLAAGDRAPEVSLTSQLRLHELLRHPGYTLLVVQRRPGGSPLAAAVAEAVRPYGDRIRVVVINPSDSGGAAPPCAVIAESEEVFDLYGVPDGDTLCLVLPDAHIGARCRGSELPDLLGMLEELLILPEKPEFIRGGVDTPLVVHRAESA